MSASRYDRKGRERLLYIAGGLVILVILSMITWVIPHVISDTKPGASPEMATPAFWVLSAIHLMILAVLIGNTRVSRRGGRLRKAGLITPGIILILMSIFLIDESEACLEHQPDLLSVAIILFISAFLDLITGVIMIMLPTRIPGDQQGNYL